MLAASRAVKGGQPDVGQEGRHRLAALACMFQAEPGEQFDGGKTESSGTSGGGRNEWMFFYKAIQDQNRRGINGSKKSGVTQSKGGGWGGSQDTTDEGERSSKR